jgi:hypothetical protein
MLIGLKFFVINSVFIQKKLTKLKRHFELEQSTALIFSIVIESLFVSIYAKVRKLNWQLLGAVACAATLITHPILWVLFIDLSSHLSFGVRIAGSRNSCCSD